MANVSDVAAYLLQQHGPMSPAQLHKLICYAQVWSIVLDDRAMLPGRILSWKNGPVVSELCEYNGQICIDTAGDPGRLSGTERETIDFVLTFFANESPLSAM